MTTHALNWFGSGDASTEANVDHAARESTGGGPGDGLGPVCIGTIEGPLRAEIARTYLEQAGITVHLQSESVGSVYGFVTGPLGLVRVFVPAAQAEEAARIFAELDFDHQEIGEQP
jgi:Putative prokaryotic signal transducing protein